MYQKIRIMVASLVVMIICLLSSTATLSYFTDTDTKTNNFIVGNASTVLTIYNDAAGGSEDIFDASSDVVTDNSEVPFYLQAKNDGNIPVYQRFRVVIPINLAGKVLLDLPAMNGCTLQTSVGATSSSTCSNANYTITYNPSVELDGVPTYAEYYIVSNKVLAVGETTNNITNDEWPTTKMRFSNLSNEDTSAFSCENNDRNNCVLGIGVYSDAIQTTGFADAVSAFADSAETYN
jgi:predicted ribosomally synthesized peptide with SipW-like signal peptide